MSSPRRRSSTGRSSHSTFRRFATFTQATSHGAEAQAVGPFAAGISTGLRSDPLRWWGQRMFPFWSRIMSETIAGIRIPDSKLAREATDLLREHGTPLLFAHSLRVYLFGALRGRHRGLTVDHELLYFGAVFHDLGLTAKYRSPDHRFEIDSADAARNFLRANGLDEPMAGVGWDGIALHTTPDIPW